jgi:hypothetical protein
LSRAWFTPFSRSIAPFSVAPLAMIVDLCGWIMWLEKLRETEELRLCDRAC